MNVQVARVAHIAEAQDRRVLLWGAGRMGESAMQQFEGVLEIAGVIHNLPGDPPRSWQGLPVMTADEALARTTDRPYVIVATMFVDEVAAELERRQYRHGADWCRLDEALARVASEGSPSYGFLEPLPPAAVQERLTGTSGLTSLVHGFNQYRIMRALALRAGVRFEEARRILDFGSGYARIVRFFRQDAPNATIVGVDVDAGLVDWCRSHLTFGEWHLVPALPPTTLPDATCSLIVSFSVFTHLSEESQARWLAELHPWLEPGGVAVVTLWTHPGKSRDYHAPHFPDYAQLTADFEAGRFCYSNLRYGPSATYGEAFVPRAHVERVWTKLFDIVEWHAEDPSSPSQTHVALRKR